MKLTLKKRVAGRKSETKQIRREGGIPVVLYSKGNLGETFYIEKNEFQKVLNKLEPGSLPSTIFEVEGEGKKLRALVKEIQYAITSYDVIHLDLEELHEGNPVTLNVPIRCVGVEECAGVKLGGALRLIVRHLRVECLPKDIPSHFDIAVGDLVIGQTKKLKEISLPKGIRPLGSLDEVAVVVAKR